MKGILVLFHPSKLQLIRLSHCKIRSWITKPLSENGCYSLKQISIKVSLVWFCSPQNFQPIGTMGHDSNCRLKAGENFPTFFRAPRICTRPRGQLSKARQGKKAGAGLPRFEDWILKVPSGTISWAITRGLIGPKNFFK